jgi:peptide/nickel transport system substrate-binding protein
MKWLLGLLLLWLPIWIAAMNGPVLAAGELKETPFFADDVKNSHLPPVSDRVPSVPRVVDLPKMGREIGRPGGVLRLLMGDQRDIRFMTLYGYTRLVVFNEKLEIIPDLLQSFDIEDERIFTFHLRPGHKWSDGQPFTSEDFRYAWEDYWNNRRLSPGGPPSAMMPNGKPPRFEVLDALTVRFTWDHPNPQFLPALAAPQPAYIYMPSHYLKQFHERYADPEKLAAAVAAAHVRDWGALHERMSRQYRPDNPDLPTLDPWRNRTSPPSERFIFERNPYYHRVDTAGHQLPYLDTVAMSLGTASLIPAKTASGESDLQARYLSFGDYTFLKEAEQRQNYTVHLWEKSEGSAVAIMPNLNAADPEWRKLMREVRFRRALSMAINRRDINNVIYYGLAKESADTILPRSPLFRAEYPTEFTHYDVAQANKLLDEIGLQKRDDDGIRLLPDGRRAEITIESAGDATETDVLQLVGENWLQIGIKVFVHASPTDVFRKRISSGQAIMSVAGGLDNGLPTADTAPNAFAPSSDSQFEWPLWGQFALSNGKEGEKIDMAAAQELEELMHEWEHSASHEQRQQIWEKILAIHAREVFTIGIVNRTQQPVVVSNRLRNVPDDGAYGFEPGAFFGIYMPDTFWFVDSPPET